MAKINHGDKGFWLEFDNYTLSVQYGIHNYCERRSSLGTSTNDAEEINSKDFEMGIFDNVTDELIPLLGGQTVAGWIPVERLPEIIAAVRDSDIAKVRAVIS